MGKRNRDQLSNVQENGKKEDDALEQPSGPRKRQHVQLPWMKVPAAYAPSEQIQISNVAGMKSRLRTCLAATGYSTFFPVQAVAWELLGGGLSTKHDLCINAPTGSGKTLAYVLPVLQRCLKLPHSRGMRALVVVPTRVLASQVHTVITSLTAHIPQLSVVLANGSTPPAAEAALLSGHVAASPLVALLPAVTRLAAPPQQAAAAGADIAVMTPGRLVHHLEALGPLWRDSLEIVVVDEADRLLRQTYHGWLPALRGALQPPAGGTAHRVLQILVSATLTRDPSKLSRFKLHSPRYIDIGRPAAAAEGGLEEFQIVTAAHSKPQALVALLDELRDAARGGGGIRVIVFAAGLDVTRRLAALLHSCEHHLRLRTHEFSSRVPQKEQAGVLEGLAASSDWVLVASDGMTRGMDVAGVTAVVNYDMPAHERTYAHRAGRTARAGRSGQVFTLLRTEHAAPFAAMVRGSGRGKPQTYRISGEAWVGAREAASNALDAVRAAEVQAAAAPA